MKNNSDTSMKISLIFVKNTTPSRIIFIKWMDTHLSIFTSYLFS